MQNGYGKNSIFLLCIVKLLESHKTPVSPSAGTFGRAPQERYCTPSTTPLTSSLSSTGKPQRAMSLLPEMWEAEQITAQERRTEKMRSQLLLHRPVRGQELDSTMLAGPFQLRMFRDQHCNPTLHNGGRVLTVPSILITHQPWFCILHKPCWAHVVFAHTTPQGSQHKKHRVWKRGHYQSQRQTFYNAHCPSASWKGSEQKQIIWRDAEHYTTQAHSLHICGSLYTRRPACSLFWLSCLQKIMRRWSVHCTSSTGLLGQVVTPPANLTSDRRLGYVPETLQISHGFRFCCLGLLRSEVGRMQNWVSVEANISCALCAGVWSPCQPSRRKNPSVGPTERELKSWGLDLGRK